jgi:CheY-like chemotaxis protein
VFVLGVAACSLLGIAASSLPRSAARNGVAVVTLPFLLLQFISGGYVPFFLVPPWLRDVLASTPGSTAVAAAAVGALIAWYLFVGRPLWAGSLLPWTGPRPATSARPGRARTAIYVSGLFLLSAVAQSQNPEAWFLTFAFSPQFFSFLDGRLAAWLGIALNFIAAGLLVYRYPMGDTAAVAFAVAAAGSAFSLLYSRWVTRIIEQSAERAQIIDQLEATRAQLAAAQHEAGRMAERQRLAADTAAASACAGCGMIAIRVLLADDHPVVREGLRGMLAAEPDIEVIGEAASGPEAVALAERLRPDVIMPGGDGVEAIRARARRGRPAARPHARRSRLPGRAAVRSGDRGPRAGRARADGRRNRPAALRERGHRQDAPAARLRQAWRLRPASARLRMARPL